MNNLAFCDVKAVTDMNAVKIDIEDDGRVTIYHSDKDIIDKAANMIKDITREVEEEKIERFLLNSYTG